MALSWVVWRQTESPLWLACIALLSALPSLPLAPLAGHVADRFHRHRILLVTQTLGCVIAALTAYFAFVDELGVVILCFLALSFGIVSSIDGPSMHSMLVETGASVEKSIARQSLAMNVGRAVAPMLAVFIIEALSPGYCFAFNALCFIPMILLMAIVRIPNRSTQEERQESVSMRTIPLLKTYPILLEVLPQMACLSVFVMPSVSLLPALSLQDNSLVSFGSMSSGLGFGAVAAALLMQKNARFLKETGTVWLAGWLCCICFAVLPTLQTIGSQWICAASAGATITFAFAAANSAIQRGAPNKYRGRFSAMYLAVVLGLVPVGQLIIGTLAQIYGTGGTVRAGAIAAFILMVMCAGAASLRGGNQKEE